MQEILPAVTARRVYPTIELKRIAGGIRWIFVNSLKPICWVLDAMFIPSPQQKYIQEHRDQILWRHGLG